MSSSRPRYRFADFIVSPSRRALFEKGRTVLLIPRYFDLLLLLLERRNEAVHRRDIMEAVWSDVVVSDGALSQAVRVLRRALGDDPRNPVFIRTVSRHGYSFIYQDVIEEADEGPAGEPGLRGESEIDELVSRLLEPDGDPDLQRGIAESLHASGTAEALRRIDRRPGHARARALLRDSRWAVPGAGPVPILGQPGSLITAGLLVFMRLRRVVRLVGDRWLSATLGAGLAGLLAGALGGLVLRFGPDGSPADSLLVGLPAIGLVLGALAACGIGGGLAAAEAVARSWRGPALVLGGAAGGWLIGSGVHFVALPAFQSLFGGDLSHLAGGFEGFVLGGALGLGYALATPTTEGGMATPRGRARLLAASLAGASCAAAALTLTWNAHYLGATSLEFMAMHFPGSDVGLEPLARLLGEVRPGVRTRLLISGSEGFLLGFGLVLGLTRRPRYRPLSSERPPSVP